MRELLRIQVVDAAVYRQALDRHGVATRQIRAVRGEIVDRNGLPLAVNHMGYNVILDRAFLPRAYQNEIILLLTEMLDTLGEEWIDNLPVSMDQPFVFLDGFDEDIMRLRDRTGTQAYASAAEIMYWLFDIYNLRDFAPSDARRVAGVRYEMERRDFSNQTPYTFATDISLQSVILLMEHSHQLPGVSIAESAIRVNENGYVAPHIVGMIGPLEAEELQELRVQGRIFRTDLENFDTRGYMMDDIIGKNGIELALEDYLRGHNGMREIVFGSTGAVIEATDRILPIPGNTVVLTIDANLQRLAQESLEAQIRFLNENAQPGQGQEATFGAVAMINAQTGEVLAAVTYPSFDLYTFREDFQDLITQTYGTPLHHRAIMGQYTPGSVYKPVVGLAGLNAGVVTPHSHIHCARIFNPTATGFQFTCMSAHGNLNAVSAMAWSCNIYFYEVGRRVGIDAIDDMARMLGLGEPTGIEILEGSGQRSNPDVKMAQLGQNWYEGDVLQTSIGQLFNRFTPLQMANFYATIGNRGRRMELTLVHEIRDYSQENVIRPFEPRVAFDMSEYVAPEAFDPIIQGLVATSRWGTARGTFADYPIDVASKTGTPQVTVDQLNSAFIAFAPAHEPEVAVAIIIERGYHGFTSAPIARAMFDAWFGFDDAAWPAWPDSGPRRLQQARLEERRAVVEEAAAMELEYQLRIDTREYEVVGA